MERSDVGLIEGTTTLLSGVTRENHEPVSSRNFNQGAPEHEPGLQTTRTPSYVNIRKEIKNGCSIFVRKIQSKVLPSPEDREGTITIRDKRVYALIRSNILTLSIIEVLSLL
jgi:hypothetical protein